MAVKKETKKKKYVSKTGKGQVHILAGQNNTIATLADDAGNVLAQCSAGALGIAESAFLFQTHLLSFLNGFGRGEDTF